MTQYGFFIDTSRCIGCNACALACKQWHDIEPGPAKPMRVHQWEKGSFPNIDVRVLPLMCMHCQNPRCLEACDHKAIYKEEKYGAVLVDKEKCQGDRNCYHACPYGAPQFLSDDPKEKMLKCTMCFDRLEQGQKPICVVGCSMRALDFGPIEELRARYSSDDSMILETQPPCKSACPAGVNAQEYINHCAAGNEQEALKSYYRITPFAGVLGRACTHACEIDCYRGRFDDAVAIRELKRYMAEQAAQYGTSLLPDRAPDNGKKIAVVGSGASGLNCAYQLRLRGYTVDVFERRQQPGGMMTYGIPAYRLPKEIIQQEISLIEGLGVAIHTNSQIDDVEALLKQGYQAVYVATGCSEGLKLGLSGENSPHIHSAIDFLLDLNSGQKPSLGKRVAVIGGGNVAMDAARSAIRLGAQQVDIISLEVLDYQSKDHLPAQEEEVKEAQQEGIRFHAGYGIRGFDETSSGIRVHCNKCLSVRDENGRFSPQYCDLADSFLVEADDVLVAIGQKSDEAAFPTGLPKQQQGPAMAEYFASQKPGIFAGGDLASGPSDLITAIAAGNEAAESIDRYCRGVSLEGDRRCIALSSRPRLEKKSRPAAKRPATERVGDFQEVSCAFGNHIAAQEAERCLHCGSMIPSAIIRREQPKKQIVPWDAMETLQLWAKRHPENGEELPDIIERPAAAMEDLEEGIFGRERLVLKPENSEAKLRYTMDDE